MTKVRVLVLSALCIFSPWLLAQNSVADRSLGSTYLTLDHWAYPALERAIAKGALPQQFLGIRPWTRMACAELVRLRDADPDHFAKDEESLQLVQSLEVEFSAELQVLSRSTENSEVQLEQLYARGTQIGGTPLRDGYHVGQTIWNDYGRPYGDGFNNVMGAQAHGEYGPAALEVQAEYQHSASMAPYSTGQVASLSSIDQVPRVVLPDYTSQNVLHFLDSYAALNFRGWQVSVGKQSQWWGPGSSTAMLETNDIDPMPMFQVDRTVPMHIPGISRVLGTVRVDAFMARMQGHEYPASPWFHGEKISFMPLKGLEIGFSRTTVWTGQGRPFSFNRLVKSYFSVGDNPKSNAAANDPGDRRGGLDIRYQIGHYLTVYSDSFTDDDLSPLTDPWRAAWNPGVYFPRLPGIAKLDLRLEGGFSELPNLPDTDGHFFYWNVVYHDAYTNKGMMLGNLVGRDGVFESAASTYWITPKRNVQASWLHHSLAPHFIPGAGYQDDIRLASTWSVNSVMLKAYVQYEHYRIPFLSASANSDVTGALEVSFWPHWGSRPPVAQSQDLRWHTVPVQDPSFHDLPAGDSNQNPSPAEPVTQSQPQ